MPGYSTRSRFTLTQLYLEDRRQRAHLKKITEMQRYSSLDNGKPFRLPYLHQNFLKHLNEKNQEINKENEVKSQKLLNIMTTKSTQSLPSFHPTLRNQTIGLPRNNTEYFQRIAKTKGHYSARDWNKQYERHKEHLRLSKDGQLFTPLGTGVNRQRVIKANSVINSKRITPTSSSLNIYYRYN
jgi:hypothetical protein